MRKKSNDPKVKLAIIGFGGMAGYHLKSMRRSGLFEVVGAYDTDPARLEAARKAKMKAYASFEELIAEPGLQAVLVATPNDVHEEYVIKLAKAKINVICEKPVTLSSESLARMGAAAEENGIVFMVHQNRRWDRDYMQFKNIVASGILGKVYRVESNVMGSHGVPGAWRKEKEKGGGMIWDWGVHLIDQMLQAVDSPVVGVTCRTSFVYGLEVDDGINLFLDFENGFVANIVIDTNAFIRLPRWQIYGLDGTASIKSWDNRARVTRVKIWNDTKNKGIQAGNGFTKTMADRSKGTIIRSRFPREVSKWTAFYENFVATVAGKEKPVVTLDSVMRCMKVMEACFQSAENQITVKTKI